jgi:hypothetical protein
MEQRNRTGAVPPSAEVQAAVKQCLDRDGERLTVERLGISRISVAKLAAGSPVRRGTAALAAVRLGLPVESANGG